jgi:metal-responsive CopG/Arc/MetJ family transcriptional regulator
MRKPTGADARQDTAITIRVSKEWLDALDAWIDTQPVKPSRTETIRVAVEEFINQKRLNEKRRG